MKTIEPGDIILYIPGEYPYIAVALRIQGNIVNAACADKRSSTIHAVYSWNILTHHIIRVPATLLTNEMSLDTFLEQNPDLTSDSVIYSTVLRDEITHLQKNYDPIPQEEVKRAIDRWNQ